MDCRKTNDVLRDYNSFTDRHLESYFSNVKRTRQLQRAGLVTRRGQLVTERAYREKNASLEQKKARINLAWLCACDDLKYDPEIRSARNKVEAVARRELVKSSKSPPYRTYTGTVSMPPCLDSKDLCPTMPDENDYGIDISSRRQRFGRSIRRRGSTKENHGVKNEEEKRRLTMFYYGSPLKLDYERIDDSDDVMIEQQLNGGHSAIIFKGKVSPQTHFKLKPHERRGYPFSLTLYINGTLDSRLSTCCEHRHRHGVRLGGKLGHFAIISLTDDIEPCYKCKTRKIREYEDRKNYEKRLEIDVNSENESGNKIKISVVKYKVKPQNLSRAVRVETSDDDMKTENGESYHDRFDKHDMDKYDDDDTHRYNYESDFSDSSESSSRSRGSIPVVSKQDMRTDIKHGSLKKTETPRRNSSRISSKKLSSSWIEGSVKEENDIHPLNTIKIPVSNTSKASASSYRAERNSVVSARSLNSSQSQERRQGNNSAISSERASPTNRSNSESLTNRSTVGSATNRSIAGSATSRSTAGSATNRSIAGSPTNRSIAGSATNRSIAGSATNRSIAGSATNRSIAGSATSRSTAGSPTNRSIAGSATNRSTAGSATNRSIAGSATNRSTAGSATNRSTAGSATNLATAGNTIIRQTAGSKLNTDRYTAGSPTNRSTAENTANRSSLGSNTNRSRISDISERSLDSKTSLGSKNSEERIKLSQTFRYSSDIGSANDDEEYDHHDDNAVTSSRLSNKSDESAVQKRRKSQTSSKSFSSSVYSSDGKNHRMDDSASSMASGKTPLSLGGKNRDDATINRTKAAQYGNRGPGERERDGSSSSSGEELELKNTGKLVGHLANKITGSSSSDSESENRPPK